MRGLHRGTISAMNNSHVSRMVRALKSTSLVTFAAIALALSAQAAAQVGVSVEIAPPPLPVYEQPEIPAPGLLWSPGYWAYGPEGYFWVPGTWVEPPQPGLLWTPGYWGWSNGLYLWNGGYWGPVVGFYGGVNYGFGYTGRGYEGGYWRDNQFYYNRNVTNITNVNIRNVYTRTVVNNVTVQRVSYVGGPGGINARPTAAEEQAAHAQHVAATAAQTQQRESAASRHDLLASVNQGKPQIAATAKAGDFSSHTVVASRAGGPVSAATLQARPSNLPQARPSGEPRALTTAGLPAQSATAAKPAAPAPVHVRDLPPGEAPAPAREGASEDERAYAQSQADLAARHQQERDTLAQQQDRDHAAAAQQQRNAQSMAQMEAQHQQQTQALQQRHAAESQQMARPATAPRAAAPSAPQHH
jgi:hypothetical protein